MQQQQPLQGSQGQRSPLLAGEFQRALVSVATSSSDSSRYLIALGTWSGHGHKGSGGGLSRLAASGCCQLPARVAMAIAAKECSARLGVGLPVSAWVSTNQHGSQLACCPAPPHAGHGQRGEWCSMRVTPRWPPSTHFALPSPCCGALGLKRRRGGCCAAGGRIKPVGCTQCSTSVAAGQGKASEAAQEQ